MFVPPHVGQFLPHLISGSSTEPATKKPDAQVLNADQQFYDSGIAFLRVCSAVNRVQQSASDIADARACESYVVGLADGIAIEHIWSKSHGDKTTAASCVEFENVPPPALVRAVLQYIGENPDRKRFRASIAVEEVLHKKFPCKVK
jgi:hypothetical protein